jgi:hypothetical protein
MIKIFLRDLHGKTVVFHHCDIDQPQSPNFAALPKYVVLAIEWENATQGAMLYSGNIVLSLKQKVGNQKWGKTLNGWETFYVFPRKNAQPDKK